MQHPSLGGLAIAALTVGATTALLVACLGAYASDDTGGPVDGGGGGADAPGLAPDGAGDAASDGDAEAADGADADARARCTGLPGPTMIDLGPFCIDSTEVTAAQYDVFLAANPSITSYQPLAVCAFNTSYAPHTRIGETGDDPVHANWCDAYAYCAWAGKRLCGALGGGAVDVDAAADASASQWTWACSQGGTTTWSYGASYVVTACWTYDNRPASGGTAPVGTAPACKGAAAPFSLVYDLIGNAEEWEDNCSGASCTTRGGTSFLNPSYDTCTNMQVQESRNTATDSSGFRCCAE
jgi:sulfatase modifying factor 1